jgi:hypothetical protein
MRSHDRDVGLMTFAVLDLAAACVSLGALATGYVVALGSGLAGHLAEGIAAGVLLRTGRLTLENVSNAAVRNLMLAMHVVRMSHVTSSRFRGC